MLKEGYYENVFDVFKTLKKLTEINSEIKQSVNTESVSTSLTKLIPVNPDVSEQEISSALVDPNTQIFQQALMSSTRSSQARSKLSEVQSRHNDILVIERKITELAQMFNELGIIIELQNDQIDQIVIQAEDTRDNIAQGLAQVTRATKLAAAVRRRKWWCFIIIVLIIIIIVVIVVVTQVVNKKTGGNNGG
jgi:syntaxin 1B/2/3